MSGSRLLYCINGEKSDCSRDFFTDTVPAQGYDPLGNIKTRKALYDGEEWNISYTQRATGTLHLARKGSTITEIEKSINLTQAIRGDTEVIGSMKRQVLCTSGIAIMTRIKYRGLIFHRRDDFIISHKIPCIVLRVTFLWIVSFQFPFFALSLRRSLIYFIDEFKFL